MKRGKEKFHVGSDMSKDKTRSSLTQSDLQLYLETDHSRPVSLQYSAGVVKFRKVEIKPL